jgi:hypothetical protein
MNGLDILMEALDVSVAALAVVTMYKICIKIIEKNGV